MPKHAVVMHPLPRLDELKTVSDRQYPLFWLGTWRKMGRKKDGPKLKPGICKDVTLREESSGMKGVDVSSILKIKHLHRLATWAGGQVGVHSLGALLGHKLAATAEASGIPLDHSSFYCERCESILQPGLNCIIRIENYKNKQRKSKKAGKLKKRGTFSQNNVIYKCKFCCHRNMIKGTTKGYIKELNSARDSRSDHVLVSKLHSSIDESIISDFAEGLIVEKVLTEKQNPIPQHDYISSPRNASPADVSYQKTPVTPLPKSTSSLKKKRKVNELEPGRLQLGSNSAELSGSGNGSSRRKRKTWSSLKDIVERKEAESIQNFSNLAIPFNMQATK